MASYAASYEPEPNGRTDPAPLADVRRVRLVALRAERLNSGHCRAEVELERLDGTRVTGLRNGHAIAIGDLRIVAEATLEALHRASESAIRFELLGVKTVRAFDQTVVLVQVAVVAGRTPVRLVGAALGDDDLPRAAVHSVLNATNRVLAHAPD